MDINIPMWRGRVTGQYYYQVPGQVVRFAGDFGTASREALALVEQTTPEFTNVSIHFTTGF